MQPHQVSCSFPRPPQASTSPPSYRLQPTALSLSCLAAFILAGLFSPRATHAAEEEDARAIFIMNRDGTHVRSVISLKDLKWLGNPHWSHDGKRIAFDARGTGKPRVFTVNLDGTSLMDLGEGEMPSWSPDDKQLAFHLTSPSNEKTADVWVQNTDGKGRSRLVEGRAPRWSPDGSQILMGGSSLRTFDMIETKPRAVLPGNTESGEQLDPTLGFDWSPDGKLIAAISGVPSGRKLMILTADSPDRRIMRLEGNLHGVAWSPRNNQLATSIVDEKSGLRQLYLLSSDGTSAAELIPGQEGDNREASWSPDGAQLVFASSRKRTAMPGLAAPGKGARLELVKRFDPGGETYTFAFAPDGRSALLGGGLLNRRMAMWDITSDELRKFEIGTWSVAMAPDGRRAACAPSHTKIVQYLDLEDGSLIREMTHGSMVISLQFSHDGSRLATSGEDNEAVIFNVDSGEQVLRMLQPDQISTAQWSRDNRLLGVCCVDKKLRLWDTTSGKLVREIEHAVAPYALAFSPDGTRALTGTGGDAVSQLLQLNYTPLDENPLYEWDIATGKLIRELKGHGYAVFGVDYSPDGKLIVSASFDGTLRLWDAETGKELAQVKGEGFVTKALFSPDGTHVLASGGVHRRFNPTEKFFDSSFWKMVPNERLRLFKVVSGSTPSSPPKAEN